LESDLGLIFDEGGIGVVADSRGAGGKEVLEGVLADGVVYDNNYPGGLSETDWLDNYGAGWPAGPTVSTD